MPAKEFIMKIVNFITALTVCSKSVYEFYIIMKKLNKEYKISTKIKSYVGRNRKRLS